MTIAYAGERGAFGELAAIEYFGGKKRAVAVPDFVDVFKGVAAGTYRFGVVPIENSLAGSIHQNYDNLVAFNLHISGELLLRIRHCLIANAGVSHGRMKKIYSHPAAFAQCKKFLDRFPGIEIIPVANTALAVKKIHDEHLNDAAAIASRQAATDFGLRVVEHSIEDNRWNVTRFIILSKKILYPPRTSQCVKSSIVFSMKNIPGALHKCLSVFALRDIDLYKIESRPMHGKGFRYLFYLDFAGDARREAQKNAINHLKEITGFYRFLGSYCADEPRNPKRRKKSSIGK
ncbi:MAG: prephenate dehydratase [Chitinispirillaceae bacterium]|nr:prephenate dehydratase [Chitinispirillaceae bacterium]